MPIPLSSPFKSERAASQWLLKEELEVQSQNQARSKNISPDERTTTANLLERVMEPRVLEYFISLYENLMAAHGAGPVNQLVLVCGVNDGEGATTISCGLAVAAATRSIGRVLLLDGNPRNPQIAQIFAETRTPPAFGTAAGAAEKPAPTSVSSPDQGVSPALQTLEAHPFRDHLRKTFLPHLHFMPLSPILQDNAGFRMADPSTFQRLLKELQPVFPFMVLDGPAVNRFPESLFYAGLVDRVLLVVHAGVTRTPVASKALERIRKSGCSQVDVVLNRRIYAIPPSIYKKL